MNIGKIIKSVFGSSAAKSVETFALTEAQKAVAALRKTHIGDVVAGDIRSLKDASLSGAEKFEQVVGNTLPLIVGLITSDGRDATLKDVEDIGRALVQDVFNDVLSTRAGSIATIILRLLGLKK